MTVRYIRQRGETIVIAVTDTGAEPGGEATVTAGIKPIVPGSYPAQPSPNSSEKIAFSAYFRPAVAELGAGWDFELPAAQSVNLAPGLYQFDFAISPAEGERFISDPAFVSIMEPASL